jgi:hypothetical protein
MDPRTFQLSRFVQRAAPKPPPAAGTGSTVQDWPMYANDRIGDCGLASQGHRIIGQETSAHQREARPTDAQVIKAYSDISGYNPRTGANDNGVYLLDVCNYMRRTGLGAEKDKTAHTIAAFAKVDNPAFVKYAAWMFGGLYVGAGLPVSAERQIDDGLVWDVGSGPEAEPYSWGGHALFMTGYDAQYVGFVTWGQRQKATWDWFHKYADEAYAFISEDYLSSSGKTPRGFDVNLLQTELGRL